MVSGWHKVYTGEQEYQAQLIVELLEAHGLHPVLLDRKDDEFRIGEAEVYVAPEELEAARRAIRENRSEEE